MQLQNLRTVFRDRALMRRIFQLAWPAMLEEALYAVVQYADTAQVGAIGAQASAAIGLTATFMWLIHAPMYAAGIGVLSCISISMGAKQEERARQAVVQSVLLTLLIGIILGIFALAISPFLPRWLGGSEEILHDASVYFAIACSPMLFRTATTVFGSVLRAAGDTKTPMLVNLVMNVLNIALNFLLIRAPGVVSFDDLRIFVWGAGLGVKGAALATAISFVIGGVLMFLAVWRQPVLGLRGQKLRLHRDVMHQCVRVGFPVGCQHAISGMAHVVFSSMVARLGTISMAAHAIASTAEEAFYVPGFGMQAAAATLAGFSVGQKDEKKLMDYSAAIMVIACFLMTLLSILLFFFPTALMSIFTADPAVIAQGAVALRIVSVSEPFFAILIIIEGIFNGVGYTRFPFAVTLCGNWGVRIVSTYICVMVFHLDLRAVWCCMVADNLTRFSLMLIRYRSGKWKKDCCFDR